MPVIGRLDGQVEEVIISPISRRQREEDPPPPDKNAETPDSPNPPAHAPLQTPDTDESSRDPDKLPVWLL